MGPSIYKRDFAPFLRALSVCLSRRNSIFVFGTLIFFSLVTAFVPRTDGEDLRKEEKTAELTEESSESELTVKPANGSGGKAQLLLTCSQTLNIFASTITVAYRPETFFHAPSLAPDVRDSWESDPDPPIFSEAV